MKWFFLALIIIPTLELTLLLWASDAMGIFPTLGLIIATGMIGAFLAKKQGLKALRDIQDSMGRLQPPGEHLINAALVLVGGVLLLTPGFISDAIGLSLLFKPTQKIYKPIVGKIIRKKMSGTRIIEG